MQRTFVALLSALLVTTAAAANPDSATAKVDAPATPAQAAFARMKALEGTWVGKAAHGEGEASDTSVTYRSTANGSAVVETLFAGTPHEMVTIYHLDGSDLVCTHYCAAGNQPSMKAVLPVAANTLKFDFLRGTNLQPGDMHMHSIEIQFLAEDRLHSSWTSWAGGKPADKAIFELVRKK